MASSQSLIDISHGSVQELAKEPIVGVPPRYVQVNQEPTIFDLSDGNVSSLPTIPVVDFNDFIMAEKSRDLELEKLQSICKEWGFFQLVNHGVNSSVVEKLKYEIEEFYELPIEEKMKYKLRPGDVEGYGQTIINSQDQRVDWADRFYMITNPLHRRKSHLLPELPASLRDTLECYLVELQKLAMTLFGLIGEAVKIEKGEILEMFEDGMQSIRMSYYPPCAQPELVMGLTPHSDASGITILLQVNEVQGLQVKKDGLWIPVDFLPNALVVNVGDILEILSNGVYKSIEHRATVNATTKRISIAMFFNPKFEAEFGPSTSITSVGNSPLFKRVVMEKYFKDFFSRKLDGKTFLEKMRI